MSFRIHVAMGDPQAPFARVQAVLAHHGLLGAAGRLRDEVRLVSMGDHFDWGRPEERGRATSDALELLRWLASHPPEQVVLLAGNHDLGRVCELEPFATDADFEAALAAARRAYGDGEANPDEEARFLARYPHVPDAECVARDFSCFSVAQRELVSALLRSARFRLAHAHRGLLLVHAGVTQPDLALLGDPVPGDAASAAAALNRFLDERVAAWRDGPLELGPLHLRGTAQAGLGGGILFQRPANPATDARFAQSRRRRFDPRTLPPGFAQAIGHIRDKKCRELLAGWLDDAPPEDGPLRSLLVEGEAVQYRRGAIAGARLYFLDGGMNYLPGDALGRYELLDLETRAPFTPARSW